MLGLVIGCLCAFDMGGLLSLLFKRSQYVKNGNKVIEQPDLISSAFSTFS